MADPMWSGGPDQFQDRYAANWATFPQWMRDPLLPSTPPMSPFAMSVTCLVLMAVPVVGTGAAINLGEYQRYYADWYDASPPGSHTDTPYEAEPPTVYTPAFGADPTTMNMLTLIYGLCSDTYAKANQAYQAAQLVLDRLPGGEDPAPISTRQDTALILSALYYLGQQGVVAGAPDDNTEILEAITDAHATTDGLVEAANLDVDALATNTQNAFESQTELIDNVSGDIDEIAQAVDGLASLLGEDTAPPVWPGVAGVTLGQSVALSDGLHLTTPMDGVIIAITTPPSRTGTMSIGGATFDYREGQIAFEDDQGHIEMWQYLGFRNALYTPRSMAHAAGARFRVLAGAEGTVTPWTITT